MFKKLINFLLSKIDINGDYLTFGKIGQIMFRDKLIQLYGFNETNLEIGTSGNIIINAGDKELDLRLGNSSVIKITKDRIDINGNLFINNKKY